MLSDVQTATNYKISLPRAKRVHLVAQNRLNMLFRRPSDALPADNRPLEHVWPRPGWRIHVLWPSLEWVVGFDLPCVKSSRGWSSYELFRGRVMVLDSMKVLVGEFALRESCVLVALCVT